MRSSQRVFIQLGVHHQRVFIQLGVHHLQHVLNRILISLTRLFFFLQVKLLATMVQPGLSIEDCIDALNLVATEHADIPLEVMSNSIVPLFRTRVSSSPADQITQTIQMISMRTGYQYPIVVKLAAGFASESARTAHAIFHNKGKLRSSISEEYKMFCESMGYSSEYLAAVFALCQRTVDDDVVGTLTAIEHDKEVKADLADRVLARQLAQLFWSSTPFVLRNNISELLQQGTLKWVAESMCVFDMLSGLFSSSL